MFQLSEYAALWGFSVFGSTIFLGGWAWPLGDDVGWGLQLALTFVKSVGIILLMFWIRTTLPRLRIDQLMRLAWKFLVPLALINLGVAAFWALSADWTGAVRAARWLIAAALLAGPFVLLGR